MPKLSASELIEILVEKYHFIHNDDEELEDIDPELVEVLCENALVFNYEGDFITECEEPEEGDPSVEKIYKFIRKSGWSLEENPLTWARGSSTRQSRFRARSQAYLTCNNHSQSQTKNRPCAPFRDARRRHKPYPGFRRPQPPATAGERPERDAQNDDR